MSDNVPRQFPLGQTEGNFDVIEEQEANVTPEVQYGFGKTAAAYIARDNFVTNNVWKFSDKALTAYETLTYDGIDGYDPLSEEERNKYDSKYWPIIATAKSPWQAGRKVLKAQEEEYYTDIIAHGSMWGTLTAGLYNAAISPWTLIPVAQGISSPKFLTSFAKGAAAAVPGILAGNIIEEANLQWAQETRNIKESALNVASGTIFGGLLAGVGGGLKVLGPKIYKKLIRETLDGAEVKTSMNAKGEPVGVSVNNGGTVGANGSEEIPLPDLQLLGTDKWWNVPAKATFWMGARLFRNPVMKGLLSKSKATASFINDALEHNFELVGQAKKDFNSPASLQSRIKDWGAQGIKYQLDLIDGYYKQLGLDEKGSKIGNAVKSTFAKDKSGYLPEKDFNRKIAIAITEGGIDKDFPVVQEMAKMTIDNVLNPLSEELVQLGVLPNNITPFGAAQYLTRMYDTQYITATRPDRVKDLIGAYTQTNTKVREVTNTLNELLENEANLIKAKAPKAEIKAAKELVDKERLRLNDGITKGEYGPELLTGKKGEQQFRRLLTPEEIRISAEKTIDNILEMSPDQIAQEIMGTFKSGSGVGSILNPRVLLVPDKFLYEKGFLQSDLKKTIPNYMNRIGRIVETEKYFKEKGYTGEGSKLQFLGEGINKDYRQLEAAIDAKLERQLARHPEKAEKLNAKAAKERLKLAKDREHDIDLAEKVLSRIMGEVPTDNGKILRLSRFLNNWAYSSQLGLMTLTALQDAVTPIMRIGMIPYIKNGVIPYVKGLASLKGNNKRLRDSMRDLAIGCDVEQSLHSLKFESGLEYELPMNFVERQSRNAANAMGILNLSNTWNDTFRRIAGTASQSNIYRRLLALNAGELKGNQLAQLKVLRMNDKALANRIISQFKKFGEEVDGAYLPNFSNWTDAEAALRYRAAVRQEVDSVIFSGKDIATYPIDVEFHGVANSFLMYMGWSFNAFANYTAPLTQRLDYNKMTGVGAAIVIATQQDVLRKLVKGEEVTEEDLDPWTMAKKGVLNSGVLGIFGETFNKTNAAFNIFPDIKVDRFADKGKLELLSGAPYSFINFVGLAAGQLATGEWNQADLKTMKRNVPLIETLFTKKLSNDAIESSDIPETRAKAHKEKLREEGIKEPKKPKKKRKKH